MKRIMTAVAAAACLVVLTAGTAQAQFRGGGWSGNRGGWGGHPGGYPGGYGWGGYPGGYPGGYGNPGISVGGRNWGVNIPLGSGYAGNYGWGGTSYPSYGYSTGVPVWSGGTIISSPSYATGDYVGGYPVTSGTIISSGDLSGSVSYPSSGGTVMQAGYSGAQMVGAEALDQDKAYVEVLVPRQDARVAFGNHFTTQTGPRRLFMSPSLQPNKDYTYTVKASWLDSNGKEVAREKQVTVRAGERSTVNFLNEARDASRPSDRGTSTDNFNDEP